jgi:hypothetical protein
MERSIAYIIVLAIVSMICSAADAQSPSVTITSPPNDFTVTTPSVTFTGTTSTNGGPSIDSLQWKFDSHGGWNDIPEPWDNWSVDITGLYPGDNDIRVRVLNTLVQGEIDERTVIYDPGPAPDLRIKSITVDDSTPYVGELIFVNVTVKNYGDASTGISTTVAFVDDASSEPTPPVSGVLATVPPLSPEQEYSITPPFSTAYLHEGSYRMWLVADSDNDVVESNESNNAEDIYITVSPELGPDLIITEVVPETNTPQVGQPISVAVTYKNVGGDSTGPTNYALDLWLNNSSQPGNPDNGDRRTIITLPLGIGQERTYTFEDVIYSNPGSNRMWALIDSTGAITEESESNNTGPSGGLEVDVSSPTVSIDVEVLDYYGECVSGGALTKLELYQNGNYYDEVDPNECTHTFSNLAINHHYDVKAYIHGVFAGSCYHPSLSSSTVCTIDTNHNIMPKNKWTIIVHGKADPGSYVLMSQGNGWMRRLAERIERLDPGNVLIHTMDHSTFNIIEYGAEAHSDSHHHVLLFDWTGISNVIAPAKERETFDDGWAYAASDALYTFLRSWNIHDEVHAFIGYSRGAVVVSETTRRLIMSGHDPQQVIYLDGEGFGGAGTLFSDDRFEAWEESPGYTIQYDNIYTDCPDGLGSNPRYNCDQLVLLDNYSHSAAWELCGPAVYEYLITSLAYNGQYYEYNDPYTYTQVAPPLDPYDPPLDYSIEPYHGNFEWNSLAGWYYHGGSGDALVYDSIGDDAHLIVGTWNLNYNTDRTSAWTWVDENHSQLTFKYKVRDADDWSCDDVAKVELISADVGSRVWTITDMCSTTSELEFREPVPQWIRDRKCKIRFWIESAEGNNDSALEIDDVQFVSCSSTPASPANIEATPSIVCSGETVTLSAQAPGHYIDWYSGECGGTWVDQGEIIHVNPLVTTTYYARSRDISTNCVSNACVSVQVSVTNAPTAPASATVDVTGYCQGDTSKIQLSASGGSGDTLAWYAGTCGGTAVGYGTPLNVEAPDETTTYYARWENSTCAPSACTSVQVLVYPRPAAPVNAAADDPVLCSGSGTILTASVPGADILWFSDSCSGSPVGIGEFFPVSPTATTTYYAKARNGQGCESIGCGAVTVTVLQNPVPAISISPSDVICEGEVAVLDAGPGYDSYLWSPGGETTRNIQVSSTGTYSVEVSENGCPGSDSVSVTVIGVAEPPSAPVIDNSAGCSAVTVTLHAEPGAGTYLWEVQPPGGVWMPFGSSEGTQQYDCNTHGTWRFRYAHGNDLCTTEMGMPATVQVHAPPPVPANIAAEPMTVCSGEEVMLTVSASEAEIEWLVGSCTGPQVGIGSTVTVNPDTSTTYYVLARDSSTGCASECVSIDVTVLPVPAIPTGLWANHIEFCEGEHSTITLGANAAGDTQVRWYRGSCDGQYLGSGTSISISAPSITTEYFASAASGVCESDCASITITVNNCTSDGRFIGEPGGSWFDAANWAGGEVPNSTMDVEIPVSVVIGPGQAYASTVVIEHSGSILMQAGASLETTELHIDQGGVLVGNGIITGDVYNAGQISPGPLAGSLQIDGNLIEMATGMIRLEVSDAYGQDMLSITGNLTADGIVVLDTIFGYDGWPGDSYVVMSFLGISGQFTDIVMPAVEDCLHSATTLSAIQLSLEYSEVELLSLHAKLTAHDPEEGHLYGEAVACSDTVIAIGARSDSEYVLGAGSVYLYDSNYNLHNEIHPPVPSWTGWFGHSLSLDDRYLVVGAHGEQQRTGAAYLYDVTAPDQPVLLNTYMSTAPAQHDMYGWAVCVQRPLLLIGAPEYTAMGANDDPGAVYVYNDSSTELVAHITASDSMPRDSFGYAVAMDGIHAVIGAPDCDDAGENAGAAYVLDLSNPALPVELYKLVPPDLAPWDQFGHSVAVSGELAIVGAWWDDSVGNESGAVYIYNVFTGALLNKMVPPRPYNYGRYGSTVLLDGTVAVVGSSTQGDAVFVYDISDPTVPRQLYEVTSPDHHILDHYGDAVTLTQGKLVVTAPHHDVLGLSTAGAAYVYEVDLNPTDCNGNNVEDSCDIVHGTSNDLNDNGIPDECEVYCPWDVTSIEGGGPNGEVDVGDFFALLQHWGPCPEEPAPCPWDTTSLEGGGPNGEVDVGDFFALLQHWGACPD